MFLFFLFILAPCIFLEPSPFLDHVDDHPEQGGGPVHVQTLQGEQEHVEDVDAAPRRKNLRRLDVGRVEDVARVDVQEGDEVDDSEAAEEAVGCTLPLCVQQQFRQMQVDVGDVMQGEDQGAYPAAVGHVGHGDEDHCDGMVDHHRPVVLTMDVHCYCDEGGDVMTSVQHVVVIHLL